MALSTTAATVYISRKNIPSPSPKPTSSLTFTIKPSRLLVRTSSDLSPEFPATETEPEKSIDGPKGSPSLINALNVERALRGIAITDVDYYAILGLQRGCTNEQVTIAYKSKVDELMYKGFELKYKGLDQEQVGKEMEALKESYGILSDVKERRLYDWSLARSEQPDRYKWPFEVDTSFTPNPNTPPEDIENTEPTRLVGYFLSAWIIISIVLSIGLNVISAR